MGDSVKGFLQIKEYSLHFSSTIQIDMPIIHSWEDGFCRETAR